MKGLLLKDWYCMVKQSRSYFLIDLVFFAAAIFNAGNLFFLTYPCLTAGLCTMAMISYEEYDGWDQYAAGLPYTRAHHLLFSGGDCLRTGCCLPEARKRAACYRKGHRDSAAGCRFCSPALWTVLVIVYSLLQKTGTVRK